MKKINNQKGFVAISVVLVLLAVVIALSVSVSFLSIGEALSSFTLMKGEDTLWFIDGCAEDGLLKSRASVSYNGGTITRPEGTCSISISKNGNIWTMNSTTSATDYKRTIQTIFTYSGSGLTITSWKEI